MIISNLITRGWVLNTLARVSGKGNFNYHADVDIGYIMLHTIQNSLKLLSKYKQESIIWTLGISISVIPWLQIGSNSGRWPRL